MWYIIIVLINIVLCVLCDDVVQQQHSFSPLKILLVTERKQFFLHKPIQDALYSAIRSIQETVQASDWIDNVVSHKDIHECIRLDWSTKAQALMVESTGTTKPQVFIIHRDITLSKANIAIFVTSGDAQCTIDNSLFAVAQPCFARKGQRPTLGKIVVCNDLERWEEFLTGGQNSAADVFRHEILHALGFGTIVARGAKAANISRSYVWNVAGQQQKARQWFMDFAEDALKYAKEHFDCPFLDGIEAEDKNGKHLNEYIFGNELMTPVISAQRNYFTEITARILESTTSGQWQWYKINRDAIKDENSEYWYGRGWGCSFVKKSCYDYMKERLLNREPTFPFCSAEDYRTQDSEPTTTICSRYPRMEIKLPCNDDPYVREIAVNGIQSHSLHDAFPELPLRFRHLMGSNEMYRFCPVVKGIIDDELPDAYDASLSCKTWW